MMMGSGMKRTAAASVFAGSILLSGCGVDHAQDRPEAAIDSSPEGGVQAETISLLPFQSLSDWVAYADHVVVLSVVNEEEVAPADDAPFIDRLVTVEVVDVLYDYPGSPSLLESFEMEAAGYLVSDSGERQPIVDEGARLEVGGEFVAALRESGQRWEPITTTSVFALDGDTLVSRPGEDAARADVSGLSVGELSQRLQEIELPELLRGREYMAPFDRYVLVSTGEVREEDEPVSTTTIVESD